MKTSKVRDILKIMLDIKECKKVLNRKESKFTDEEIKKIREYLYKMARIVVETKTEQGDEKRFNS